MAFGSDVVQTPSLTPAAFASYSIREMPGRKGRLALPPALHDRLLARLP